MQAVGQAAFCDSSMRGELFKYAVGRVAFESPARSNKKLILIGGLSDGLMPVPYVELLETVCADNDWSLVQPIFSSSYTGFGHSSLDQDVVELDQLLLHLAEQRSASSFALVGHSTGTQDICHYLKHGVPKTVDMIQMVALQAPVSDRESASICRDCHASQTAHDEEIQRHLTWANRLVDEAKENEMMPRAAFWAPISAERYLDLFQRKGRDDYFSSDYTDDELRERLGHIGRSELSSLHTCLVACSGSDEYVPQNADVEKLMHRLCRAMNSDVSRALPLLLPKGNHNLSSGKGAEALVFVNKIGDLLKQYDT